MAQDTPVTWVVVADSRQAQFYMRSDDGYTPIPGNWQMRRNEALPILEPVIAGMFTAPPANDDQPLQRSSRHKASEGKKRRLTEVQDDTTEAERTGFAIRIADFLNTALEEEMYDALIIAAPPHMVRALHDAFSKDVAATIRQTVDKDLTHIASRDLQDHINELSPA